MEQSMRLRDLMTLCEYGEDRSLLLRALQDWGLILREGEYPCPKCGTQLKLAEDNTSSWSTIVKHILWPNSQQELHRTREFFCFAGILYCPTRPDAPQDDLYSEAEDIEIVLAT